MKTNTYITKHQLALNCFRSEETFDKYIHFFHRYFDYNLSENITKNELIHFYKLYERTPYIHGGKHTGASIKNFIIKFELLAFDSDNKLIDESSEIFISFSDLQGLSFE
jgi:hypothetical protein